MPGNSEASVNMACLVSEVIGNSATNFENAIAQAMNDFGKIVGPTNMHGVDIVSQKIQIKDGTITNYRVVLKIAYDGTPQ